MMLYNERAELILQQLQLQSTVKVTELSQLLQVSVDTVRRDLKNMEQEGWIKYVRGGACLPEDQNLFSNFTGREIIHSELKREAARKALDHIKEGDVVALNSGTTNTVLAQEMSGFNLKFTVVTNNYAALRILMQNPAIRLIAVGGTVDPLERSTYGNVCEREFAAYRPDLAFLSINAVNYQDGYTDFRLDEIGVIQTLARNARREVAVMDSSKLGQCSKRVVLLPEQVDLLLMDEPYGQMDIKLRFYLEDEVVRLWKETGSTVLFITHNIEEAVYLAERILILSNKPTTIKEDFKVDLPRPRDVTSPEFTKIRQYVTDQIKWW